MKNSLLVLFLLGGLELVPLVPLILDFFICSMRGLDWTCGFKLCSWKHPSESGWGSWRDLRRLVQPQPEQFCCCLSVIGVPLDWRKDSVAEKDSLEATILFMENHVVCGEMPWAKFLRLREMYKTIRTDSGLIEYVKTYKFMRKKKQRPKRKMDRVYEMVTHWRENADGQ